ncbi:MAG: MraY family glycosyltransferase [Elusimicrobiota bacterium]|jgi:UDP-GlcNAc:undecaprenyl-phosphate GlcNAc-1-phosphate transferase
MGTIYLTVFIVACATSAMATPLSIWLAKRYGVMDQPDPRKVHSSPIPRWGGLAIYLGILVGLFSTYLGFPRFRALLAFRHSLYDQGRLIEIVCLNKQFAGILVGLTIVVALGMMDDRKPVLPVYKLLSQIIASLVVLNYGVQISGLRLPFLDYFQFPIFLSQVITVFWIIGFMNAVNLADGLDGLAAGLAAIASATFLAVAIIQGNTDTVFIAKQLKLAAVLSAALAGSCLGFLPHNFSPAKVFMGDGGALGIGFLLGAITVIGTLKTTAVLSVMIPIIVVALPVLDVGLAMIRRYKKKSRIMEPDREHLHHKLMAKGWTAREVVLLVYVVTMILSVAAIFIAIVPIR